MKKYPLFVFYFCFFFVLMFSWMTLSSGETVNRDADFEEAYPRLEAKKPELPKTVAGIGRTRNETAEKPAVTPRPEDSSDTIALEALPQPAVSETPSQPAVTENVPTPEAPMTVEPVADVPPANGIPPVAEPEPNPPAPPVAEPEPTIPEPESPTAVPPDLLAIAPPEPSASPGVEKKDPEVLPASGPPASAPRKYELNVRANGSLSSSLLGNYKALLSSPKLESMVTPITVEVVDDRIEPRGQMTMEMVSLVTPLASESESLKVLAHELGHVVDIRYLVEGRIFSDPSDAFYDISWVDITTKKPKMALSDFVSGYAMTNKYEDFGESFDYYLFHNADFAKRAKTSKPLKAKYEFFQKKIFPNQEFVGTGFELDPIPQYNWDTTKIPVALNKYLFYMK